MLKNRDGLNVKFGLVKFIKKSLITKTKLVTIIFTLVTSSAAVAEIPCEPISWWSDKYCLWEWCDRFQPYFGLDVKTSYMMAKGDWGREYPRYYPGGNLYFALRFHKYFSVELGYDQTVPLVMTRAFGPQDTFFKNNLSGFSYRRRVSMGMPHFDVNYLLCICDSFEFLASVGVGFLQIQSRQVALKGPNGPIDRAITTTGLQPKPIFRARVGAQYYFTKCFGIRALGGYDTTSRIRIVGENAGALSGNNITVTPFKDAASISIGFFVCTG